ncbi:MAG: hypothetical protein KA143_04595 [Saprospiraceae bacterium]|nr:hypothetical protein [Saprospiraceae bacterium]
MFLSTVIVFVFFLSSFSILCAQNKTIYHGRDKQIDSFTISTGDKYYDSGGPGGSRLPEQPGNYFNCSDPFNESTNCTSLYTFCASSSDTVALNFNDYLIVTGDRFRIFSGKSARGTILFNSQNQGVSINGMRLTTGSLIKSKSNDGCITVEMFATTIGNSIGWDADFIIYKKNSILDPCTPICKDNINIFLPIDTCFQKLNTSQFISNFYSQCKLSLNLFYPGGTDDLKDQAVNSSHVGKRFLFQVSDSSGSFCVGYVKVNETAFQMTDCATDTMSCIEWENSLAHLNKITTCDGKGYTVVSSKFISFDCQSNIIGLVVRDLDILSDSGNVESCKDTTYLKKVSFDTIQKPGDIKFNCSDLNVNANSLTPAFLLDKFDLDHDFQMDGTQIKIIPLSGGLPFNDTPGICATIIKYNDLIIPGCGSSLKIRRQWALTSACNNTDSVFIQYITIDDTQPPFVQALESIQYSIPAGFCTTAILLDSLSKAMDCGFINQKLELSYTDPDDPAKQVVINAKLPLSLNLPAGAYFLRYTFTDPCFNVSTQNQCLWVSPTPDIQIVGDTLLTNSVDNNSCFSRVYAKDFESYAAVDCKEKLHFAVAHVDTILFYRNYWKNKFSGMCSGQDDSNGNESVYNQYIENWINTNVYSDFIDLPPCQFNKISLKAFDISFVPVKDASFNCSVHKWISYHADVLYRVFKNSTNSCDQPYSLLCLDEINQLKSAADNKFKYNTSAFLNDSTCKSEYIMDRLDHINDFAKSINIQIRIVDTLIQPLQSLPDIIYVENDQIINRCCDQGSCLGESFNPNSWPGKLMCSSCDSADFVRNFSGPLHAGAVYDNNGYYTYPNCKEYDSIRFFKPIYCSDFVKNTKSDPIDQEKLFSKLILNGEVIDQKTISVKVNCINSWQLNYSDSVHHTSGCLPDTITRHWSLVGSCNQNFVVSQRLIYKPKADFEVMFPKDALIDCSAKLIKDSIELWKQFGYPVVRSNSVGCMEITFKDSLISSNKVDYCLLTQRVWKIVDLAHYDPMGTKTDYILNDTSVADNINRFCVYRNLKEGGDGIMYYKQIITYVDLVPPVFSIEDTMVNGSNCMAPSFNIKINITDDCTPDEVLFSFHSLDLYSDGIFENNYSKEKGSVHFKEGLPPGIHRFRSISTDLCGNTDTAYTNITITDDGTPMAHCVQSSVLIPIPGSRSIKIFAKDFDAGSLAGCEKGPLHFSFSENPLDSARFYTCDSIGDKSLSVFITNTAKHQSVCFIKLQVVSDTACDQVSSIISINGNVMNPNKEGINKVEIKTNALFMKTITNENGVYQLKSVLPGQNITLVPNKIDDPLNGISTIDLLLIERHIKGLSTITDPYQLIAADINRSGSVTITDLIELRKMILGTIINFSNNKDWIFIPESFKFNDPLSPWTYPETISYNPVTNSRSDVNFIGVKVGDVNNSATINAQQLESRHFIRSLELVHTISTHPPFDLHSFYLPKTVTGARAFQLEIKVNPATALSFQKEDLLQESNGLFSSMTSKTLKLIWTNPTGMDLVSQIPLFTLKTLPSTTKTDFTLAPESFIFNDLETYDIKLNPPSHTFPTSLSVYPNPSHSIVNLRIYINDLQTEKISLTNLNGQKLDHLIPPLNPGWNHISLNKNDLGGSGQFFFYIISPRNVKRMKFIVL